MAEPEIYVLRVPLKGSDYNYIHNTHNGGQV
jgi:hypothetical protein